MPINQISQSNKNGVYFITPTIWNWYYIFDRHNRWQILSDSLHYLQSNSGLNVHGYVFMLNHLHMIIEADDVAACLRDFKRHTSREIRKNIEQHEPRLLSLFTKEDRFQFWKPDNQPRLIENKRFYMQKLNYIHDNPVRKGYVERPEHWKWSSANPESAVKTMVAW